MYEKIQSIDINVEMLGLSNREFIAAIKNVQVVTNTTETNGKISANK